MNLFKNERYLEDINYISKLDLPWDKLRNRSLLISGATGLIGSCLIDVIMYKNIHNSLNCKVYAISRNKERAKERFKYDTGQSLFKFITHDINQQLEIKDVNTIDYIFHLASNTYSLSYATDPIGTIATNIIGTQNILECSIKYHAIRTIFISSCEIYGENRGDVEQFSEEYCGYIDSNTLRAAYPESKRCGEALCQAYIKQKGLDVVISRLPRVYGPTMLMSNNMTVISQFIKQAVGKEDIILKSEGTQYYSYLYVIDVVSALLSILLLGKCGEAYNVSDSASDIRLKDLVNIITDITKTKVKFELPNKIEREGHSKVTKSILKSEKLRGLGWKAKYDIMQGIRRTIGIIEQAIS